MVTTSNRTYPDTDLQEAATRHDTAAAVVDALTRALDTIPSLSSEITRLRRRLITTLADSTNLVAAAKATLNADADGEQDPLYYLRDELTAQGQLRPKHHRQERP